MAVLREDADNPNLGATVRGLVGERIETAALDRALVLARTGTASELISTAGERVLFSPSVRGCARIVFVPGGGIATGGAAVRPPEVSAGVSHELANALGAIAGWARLAKQGRRVQEALDLIEMSAESAWSAARRMLGSARGAREPAPEPVDLSAFVDEAVRLLSPKATAKGVHVRTSIEPGLYAGGDRGSAWSIVWNLAANAVEALSPGGTVELRLSRIRDAALLVVEDDGPGMTEEQQRRAFEPYFTTKTNGTGLGLALVKQTVGELGGSIELKSVWGAGTRFSVALPLATGTAKRTTTGAKRSSGVFYAEPIPHRVLVVDDDLGLREMIATALGMRGADVVAVGSAEAALAEQGPFALAIVDLLLPDQRGDALLARLRAAGVTEVGLLVTGTEPPANLLPEGAPDVLLRKPFELEELFESLAIALDSARGARDSAAG